MRTAIVILSILLALSLWWNFDTYQTSSDNQKALQAEIISGKNKADSAHAELLASKDSIQILTLLIANKNEETERAHEETRNAIRYAESLKFVRFTRDSQRDSVLLVLYPKQNN
jgi:hypothetical protein